MKVGDAIIQAAKKQAEGEVAVHIANIKVYQTMPAGIGEHSDITEAVMAELDKLAAANDRLEMIEKYFSDEALPLFS
jgi:C4-dicarboxylate-specific signal transduction histidine kinase|tara:strand:+ start:513 stop:743 length:231 start_codon:yes stop_codon:yes gene_type:complete